MTTATRTKKLAKPAKPGPGGAARILATPAQPEKLVLPEGLALKGEVDELAGLLQWERAFKDDPRSKRLEALKKKLAVAADTDRDPAEISTLAGMAYSITWTARSNARRVNDMRELHQVLGDSVFYAEAKMPAEALDAHLTEAQRLAMTTTSLTGPRKCRGERPLVG